MQRPRPPQVSDGARPYRAAGRGRRPQLELEQRATPRAAGTDLVHVRPAAQTSAARNAPEAARPEARSATEGLGPGKSRYKRHRPQSRALAKPPAGRRAGSSPERGRSVNRQLAMEVGEPAGELVATLVAAAWSERYTRNGNVHHVAANPSGTRGRGCELRASRRLHTGPGSRADGFLVRHKPSRKPPVRPASV